MQKITEKTQYAKADTGASFSIKTPQYAKNRGTKIFRVREIPAVCEISMLKNMLAISENGTRYGKY